MANVSEENSNFLMRISHEMAGGLQQLTGLAYDCFEVILSKTEKEFDKLLEKKRNHQIKIGRYEIMYRMTHQSIPITAFRHLEEKNDARIIKAILEAQNHSFVIRGVPDGKNNFVSTTIISKIKYDSKNKTFKVYYSDDVFYHYLNTRTTFKYNKEITDSFKYKFSKGLYILACSWDTLSESSFKMSESMIRKFFSYDIIEQYQFEYFDIYDEEDLNVVDQKGTAWQMIYKTLRNTLEEIKDAFVAGKSPFWLDHKIYTEYVHEGKKGKPVGKHTVEFTIMREYVEDAEVTEIIVSPEDTVDDKNKKRNQQPTVMEIPFQDISEEQVQLMEKIKEEIRIILTAEGLPSDRVSNYLKNMIQSMKRNIDQRPELSECVSAWIQYTMEWAGKYNKTPQDLSWKLQSNLKIYCMYEPEGPSFNLEKPLKWPPHYKNVWLGSVEDEISHLRSMRDFVEKLKSGSGVSEETMESYILGFAKSLYNANGQPNLHTSEDAMTSHFECWVRVQNEINKNKYNNNNYGNNRKNQGSANTQPHAAAEAAIRRRHERAAATNNEPPSFFE